ncbi:MULTISPECIES: sugar kinase [unclassified Rathayibacter]|uniref:sugar kinase n=1 Tax=unclassified Rathayibacter TaxID=2609250 RepID=UPI000F4C2802|nr:MULTISPECIES: sugar kinase [unclassified Rathayibacter]ROP49175.1 2-dehydro-3-deoxygluconokinase [Rathayibacter sp. PhB186]ROS50708.1 2-dehydro-3-deoxygluconokinase [Rathayibacter sp. PhB185]
MSTGVLLIGEALGVLRSREIGSLVTEDALVLSTGGAELNVAIGLARLGERATWVGRVGDDAVGRRVLRDLQGAGVQTVAVVDTEASTGLLLKERPSAGRTRVSYYRAGSAGSRLRAGDVPDELVETADLVHVTGITAALSEDARSAVHSVVDRAAVAGVPVSFDVNHRASLWRGRDPVPHYRTLATVTRVLFGGRDELALLTGLPEESTPEEFAEAVRTFAPHLEELVVKDGAHGASVVRAGATEHRPAVPVTVVDTVGAGDAFVAGYLSARIHGANLAGRLDRATRTGAAACTHVGDWEGAAFPIDLVPLAGDPVTR